MERQQKRPSYQHALVIGGGMAGLLAARILSPLFAQVTVVERDPAPAGPAFREGTPQAVHRHGISTAGKEIFEKLFPGLDEALAAAGCPVIGARQHDRQFGADLVLLRGEEPPAGPRPALSTRIVSRPRLEWEILQRVSALPNVRFLRQGRVERLVRMGQRLQGVVVQQRGQDSEPIAADLVVDASGRQSKVMRWLEEAGFERPVETIVDPTLMMVTRWYKMPPTFTHAWEGLIINPRFPYHKRGAMLTCIEGQYFLLTLSGKAGNYPPTRGEELMPYLAQLRQPGIYQALRHAEPLTPLRGYANTTNRRRHFEQLDAPPDNFVVIGDAACGFNPGHGHGMGEACKTVMALWQCLQTQPAGEGFAGFSRRYYAAAAQVLEPTWQEITRLDQQEAQNLAHSRLPDPQRLPLEEEPHVSVWQGYAQVSARDGVLTTLRQHFAQLRFPVAAGIQHTPAYRVATGMGMHAAPAGDDTLELERPEALQLGVHQDLLGRAPVLSTPHRPDFERLVQALGKRNEPVPIPATSDVYLIVGLNNWDRIHTYKRHWLAGQQGPAEEAEQAWQGVFRELTAHKALYQDRFIIAEHRLATLPPAPGAKAATWPPMADALHQAHAAAHYHLFRLLPQQRETPLHGELLAYYVALVQTSGRFRADWFLHLLNPSLASGGSDELRFTPAADAPAAGRRDWLALAAENVARFDQAQGATRRDAAGLLLMTLTLDTLSLEEMTLPDAPGRLAEALQRLAATLARQSPPTASLMRSPEQPAAVWSLADLRRQGAQTS